MKARSPNRHTSSSHRHGRQGGQQHDPETGRVRPKQRRRDREENGSRHWTRRTSTRLPGTTCRTAAAWGACGRVTTRPRGRARRSSTTRGPRPARSSARRGRRRTASRRSRSDRPRSRGRCWAAPRCREAGRVDLAPHRRRDQPSGRGLGGEQREGPARRQLAGHERLRPRRGRRPAAARLRAGRASRLRGAPGMHRAGLSPE